MYDGRLPSEFLPATENLCNYIGSMPLSEFAYRPIWFSVESFLRHVLAAALGKT